MTRDLIPIILAALTAAGAGALAWRDLRARWTALSPFEREFLKRRAAGAALLAVSAAAAGVILGVGGPAAALEFALWAAGAGLAATIILTLLVRWGRRRYADHVVAALRQFDESD